MNKFVAVQVVGMVLLVGGGQGLIRIVIDHADRGFLGWIPGGFASCLVAYAAIVVVGMAMAAIGEYRRRQPSS